VRHDPFQLVGESEQIRYLRNYLPKVAASDASVLISGETGTGKECVARFLHQHGGRSRKALVCINCSAVPDGLLESEMFGYERGAFTGADRSFEGRFRLAAGGTVFLDEVGDMNLHAQAKLLRVLESHEVTPLGARSSTVSDFRIVAATNADPYRLVRSGRLRSDLYYRLNVVQIHLPPLRDRKEDIVPLFRHFMSLRLSEPRSIPAIDEQALAALMQYGWPGNARELRNLVDRILVDPPQGKLTLGDLPEEIRECTAAQSVRRRDDERTRLLVALTAAQWNKSKAAGVLHWSRMTLYRKMNKFHIKGPASHNGLHHVQLADQHTEWPL
jgi:transcriptional regulator with PAS, ATPase and Fis domain